MQLHQLINDLNKLILDLYFQFKFYIRKLDKSLHTSLLIRIQSILTIDTNKNVIRYWIEYRLRYVNKYVNNPTSLQMEWISLIRRETWLTNNGRNIILFDVYFRELLHFIILVMFYYSGFIVKKCCDMPSPTLISYNSINLFFPRKWLELEFYKTLL